MQEELEGRIKSVVWSSQDGGFSIMRPVLDGSSETITITGSLAGTNPGERVRLKGQWETQPKYGRQLKVEEYLPLLPASLEGIEQYLGSGLVEGIGPAMAGRIVARFGEEALRVIEETPGRLSEVQGIGPKRISAITKAWQGQRGIRDAMLFLQSHGVSPGYAARIYRQYGDRAVQVVRENPYRLAHEVEGIGFLLADRFARGLGFGENSPARAEAGIMHVLKASSDDGHLFLPSTELLQQSQKLLESDRAVIARGTRIAHRQPQGEGGRGDAGGTARPRRERHLPSRPARGRDRDRDRAGTAFERTALPSASRVRARLKIFMT